jgi:iron complex transport system ATP-binding protein
MSILELSSVTSGYGQLEIVNGISFALGEGEFCGIIGPNGAGKTTLFRLITRVLAPWRGVIRYRGRDIAALPRRALAAEIATMPQSLETPFSFTVREFVLLGRFPHRGRFEQPGKKDMDIVDESLRLTDAAALAGKRLTALSGGERQRVILAQALAQSPRLLLLDEPTAHLDIGHQMTILDLIRRLNHEQGISVLMVQHDLNLSGLYCDKLVLMDRGRIFAQGTPAEVLTYQNIEAVYKTVVIVKENPISHKPYVFPVPKDDSCRR